MTTDSTELYQKKCKPCSGDTPAITGSELQSYKNELDDKWELIEEHHLHRTYSFDNFRDALEFTYEIGIMSEEENHHPKIQLTWGKVDVTIYTHAIDGLSENDFIWAAKADKLYF